MLILRRNLSKAHRLAWSKAPTRTFSHFFSPNCPLSGLDESASGRTISIMDKPNIADTKPAVMELEPGDYWWCACGLSKGQPFCDGSHAGTKFAPQKVTIEEKKTIALCNCKHTDNPGFCDGSHSKL